MLPLAREMLKMGSEVVLCANSLPAINDITVQELKELVDTVGKICPIIQVILSPPPFPIAWLGPTVGDTSYYFPDWQQKLDAARNQLPEPQPKWRLAVSLLLQLFTPSLHLTCLAV